MTIPIPGVRPQRCSCSTAMRRAAQRAPALMQTFEQPGGVERWAQESMGGRLGRTFPPEGVAWWTQFMGRTAASTQISFMPTIACADIRADVPKIACPTLVITTEDSGLVTVDETRAWQQTMPDSELLVLPGDSYHVAASDAVQCAQATLAFIARRDPDAYRGETRGRRRRRASQ